MLSVSYSGPPSGPKLPAPTPGASVSSSSMPTGKRASLAGSSKTTHAPLGGAATPIASTATPSPKASSTPTNMTHPMDHYLNHNNSNHRRTSTTTTTATPTPEQETPPPSSSSASHNGTTKIHTLTPAEEVEEELTKKRFKNTLAARRSRAKKVMILEQERLRATELETANKALQIRVAVLEAEQKQWAVIKEAQALRIARLEEELARARQVIKERE
ncbi:hypothetical protein EC991_005626 [Linnemannia zychae]|nr:hypothetical protein EC991_005626 [Linnemannia zychae]